MLLDELELDICTIHTPKDEEVWGGTWIYKSVLSEKLRSG